MRDIFKMSVALEGCVAAPSADGLRRVCTHFASGVSERASLKRRSSWQWWLRRLQGEEVVQGDHRPEGARERARTPAHKVRVLDGPRHPHDGEAPLSRTRWAT